MEGGKEQREGEEVFEGLLLYCSNYKCVSLLKIFTAPSQMVSSWFHAFIHVQVTHA